MAPWTPVLRAQSAGAALVAPGDRLVVRFLVPEDGAVDRPPMQTVIDVQRRVMLPIAGALSTEGLSAAQLLDSARARLEQYLRPATFSLLFERRILVHGDVRVPGFYYVDPTVRLREALSLAGGPNDAGRRRDVVLVRGASRSVIADWAIRDAGLAPLESGDELFVERAPWVQRNVGFMISLVSVMGTVLLSLASL